MIKVKHLKRLCILIVYFFIGFILFKAQTSEIAVDMELAKARGLEEISRSGAEQMPNLLQFRLQWVVGLLTFGLGISPIIYYVICVDSFFFLFPFGHLILSMIITFLLTAGMIETFLVLYYLNQFSLASILALFALTIGLAILKAINNSSNIDFRQFNILTKSTCISLSFASIFLNEETQAYLIDLVIRWQGKYSPIIVQIKILLTSIEIVLKQLINKLNPFKSKTPKR